MLSKKTFVDTINSIIKQDVTDDAFATALETVCDSSCLYGTKNLIYASLLVVLKEIFEDKDDWISWWLYDKEFGKDKTLKAYYKNKKEIKLDSPEDLYKFLIKNLKK